MTPKTNAQIGFPEKLLLLAISGVLLVSAWFGVSVFRADWAFFRAEKAMAVFKAHMELEPQSLSEATPYLNVAEENIVSAISIWSTNSAYLSLYAQVIVWRGYQVSDPQEKLGHYRQALDLLRESLQLRPTHAETWARLAEYKMLALQRDSEMYQAREKALELGGANVELVNRMMKL